MVLFFAGHDAPSPRRVIHSPAGSGRAHLLGAEQSAEVFRAHAQVRGIDIAYIRLKNGS